MERVKLLTPREHNYKARGRKISQALTGRKLTPIHRARIISSNTGHPTSPETRKRISDSQVGRVFLPSQAENIRIAMIARNGTGDYLDPRESKANFDFINFVLLRDNYTCQHCGMSNEECLLKYRRRLEVHHVKPWDDYPELRFEVSNGLTLCRSCHKKEENRMQKGAGKEKGSQFERDIAWYLSHWISGGARTNLIWRSEGSGARFTSSGRGSPGDLSSTDPLTDTFFKLTTVECKFWQWIDLLEFLERKGELYKAYEKHRLLGLAINRVDILIFKQNRRPILIAFPKLTSNSGFQDHLLFNSTLVLCNFKLFMETTLPETFLCDCRVYLDERRNKPDVSC